MTSVVEINNFNEENARFNKEFEEYRRACRERYQQQNTPPPVIEEEEVDDTEESEEVDNLSLEEEQERADNTGSPVLRDPRFTISPANNAGCNTTLPNIASPVLNTNGPRLSSSVESLKKPERRNSFSKMMSYCSNILRKSTGSCSPTLPSNAHKEKERAKLERKKAEQDWRMARFIAELEMEGRSDAEIQLHLYHLRDQAQFARPRSNSVGDWFREMHQAFKDEFTARNVATVHVSTINPFAGAAPANYVHDMGYSYEDLVSLEPVPRGLKSLEHLPTTVYEGQELPSDQTSCAVCMADFETSEELRSLHCTHHFHKECIDRWLGVAPTCPVCKGEVHHE